MVGMTNGSRTTSGLLLYAPDSILSAPMSHIRTRHPPKPVPASLDELVREWDRCIVAAIYRFSRGAVRPDDLDDLKQAVYLRIWQTGYLDRCRVLIDARGGRFSTYLYLLVRSVLVNIFMKNGRDPLNHAVGVVDRQRDDDGRLEGRLGDRTDALILETYKDLVDDRAGRQYEAAEWLEKFAQHLQRVRPHTGPIVVLPDGTRAPRSMALAFRLWCYLKDKYGDTYGWRLEMARILGVSDSWVSALIRKIKLEAVAFLALGVTCA